MIPLEKLKGVTHVVTHANCPDGVASALILKDALPDVRVSFMQYDSAEHKALEPAPGMLFCDFSPYVPQFQDPRGPTTQAWIEAGAAVLDHHPTRRDVVEAFGDNGVFGENERGECGAWLAYEHVWKRFADEYDLSDDVGRAQVRRFAELAAVRDTWKNKDPRWDEALRLAELQLFWRMKQPLDYYFEDNRVLGGHLLEKKLAAANESLGEAHVFTTTKGTNVCMFQGVSTTGDAAELAEQTFKEATIGTTIGLGAAMSNRLFPPENPDLIVGFHYKVDVPKNWEDAEKAFDNYTRGEDLKLKIKFSMRSHTGYDVGEFAKRHGGGGHAAAASFTVEVSPELSANPYQVFRLLLEEMGDEPLHAFWG